MSCRRPWETHTGDLHGQLGGLARPCGLALSALPVQCNGVPSDPPLPWSGCSLAPPNLPPLQQSGAPCPLGGSCLSCRTSVLCLSRSLSLSLSHGALARRISPRPHCWPQNSRTPCLLPAPETAPLAASPGHWQGGGNACRDPRLGRGRPCPGGQGLGLQSACPG